MIALHERIIKLCPVIKEMIVEETDDELKAIKRS
jgi:hypothetical protein